MSLLRHLFYRSQHMAAFSVSLFGLFGVITSILVNAKETSQLTKKSKSILAFGHKWSDKIITRKNRKR
jgi:hypothetical protein